MGESFSTTDMLYFVVFFQIIHKASKYGARGYDHVYIHEVLLTGVVPLEDILIVVICQYIVA